MESSIASLRAKRLQSIVLKPEAGKPVTLDRVLFSSPPMTGSRGRADGCKRSIVADVVEHFRGEKKIAFKMKRRKAIIAPWAIARR